jgi:hypothetical protein
MDTKVCVVCGEEKKFDKFRFSFNSRSKLQTRCKSCYSKRERSTLKLDFFNALGRSCNCCGEDDVRFLTLDHADNSGAEHRKTLKCHQIYRVAKNEDYPVDKYQVLCFNCNSGRSSNGGICPHKDGVLKSEAWAILEEWTVRSGQKFINREGSKNSQFKTGFDERRTHLHRRVLKQCPYCEGQFGTHELARHKRAEHQEEVIARRKECLAVRWKK